MHPHWPFTSSVRRDVSSVCARLVFTLLVFVMHGAAQNCQTSSEIDDATRDSIAAAGRHYFDMAARGDTAAMRAGAIASVASDFSGIDGTVKDHQQDVAGADASVKSTFLLAAEGAGPIPNAEFYCGVFGKSGQTSGSAVFSLTNLPPGKYAIALLETTSAKAKMNFSLVLQQFGADWKLAGLYIKPAQVAGHDTDWFTARAREYKANGQLHNSWFYYVEARSLVSPVPFMSTQANDKLYDEAQPMRPSDIPADGKTVDLVAGAVTYKLTALFPEAVGGDVDLIVKYQVADASNTSQAYQSNLAVAHALVAKYPEVRDAFTAAVARAVDSAGHDYGTLLAMKDIK